MNLSCYEPSVSLRRRRHRTHSLPTSAAFFCIAFLSFTFVDPFAIPYILWTSVGTQMYINHTFCSRYRRIRQVAVRRSGLTPPESPCAHSLGVLESSARQRTLRMCAALSLWNTCQMFASNSPMYIFNSSGFLPEKKFRGHGRCQCLGEENLDPAWRAIQQDACRSKMHDGRSKCKWMGSSDCGYGGSGGSRVGGRSG